MKIQEWFINGCNYEDGVAIYATLKTAKPNLLQLFKRKKTSAFAEKLKYELGKLKDTDTNFTPLVATKKTAPVKVAPAPETKFYKPLRISDFPFELHPVYIKQKNDFATACSLKMQLNDLPADAEEKALEFCLQIDSLFHSIELAWKQLDHYTATKTILEVVKNDFSNLTPSQLLQRRNNYRSNLTKANKRLIVLQNTPTTTIAQKTKVDVKIAKCSTKINQLEKDIYSLKQLIEGK